MIGYVALLRAVNVGGTGKLSMSVLADLCKEAGFSQVKTYIASGNVVFQSGMTEAAVRSALQERLLAYAGKSVGVIVRTADEVAGVVARNPFADKAGSQVAVLFVDAALPADPMAETTGRSNEDVRLGKRELFVFYPDGIGRTRLRIPVEKHGTARNINTVTKLADMVASLTWITIPATAVRET